MIKYIIDNDNLPHNRFLESGPPNLEAGHRIFVVQWSHRVDIRFSRVSSVTMKKK